MPTRARASQRRPTTRPGTAPAPVRGRPWDPEPAGPRRPVLPESRAQVRSRRLAPTACPRMDRRAGRPHRLLTGQREDSREPGRPERPTRGRRWPGRDPPPGWRCQSPTHHRRASPPAADPVPSRGRALALGSPPPDDPWAGRAGSSAWRGQPRAMGGAGARETEWKPGTPRVRLLRPPDPGPPATPCRRPVTGMEMEMEHGGRRVLPAHRGPADASPVRTPVRLVARPLALVA
jgi:hypothetical protein